MAAKRIYQLAKEFERDEKELIAFLTSQGIKVGNRLSAVTDDAYNLLKAKYTAPPEPPPPPPEPEPKPEPTPELIAEIQSPEQPEATNATQPAPGKKKKKKKKAAQPDDADTVEAAADEQAVDSPFKYQIYDAETTSKGTQKVYLDAIAAGNAFISNYNFMTKKQRKELKPRLTRITDPWNVLHKIKFDNPDISAARYWNAVNKLVTGAFKLVNEYGLIHRNILAEMRNNMKNLGEPYEPREIFTDEENQRFAEQQKAIFKLFGHGMGAVNDNLFALKMHAERMKLKYEFNDFLEYATNPAAELRCNDRVPFNDLADAITFSVSGIARRLEFYVANKEIITLFVENFFAWVDGYAKLKAEGAPAEKLEKYLDLQQRFFDLTEFMGIDNLIFVKNKTKTPPCVILLNLLNEYRDNMDDPDAERNFKYKSRGVTNGIYKPKEFVFVYQFAGLEIQKDYRPPEEVAAAEAEAPAANEESPAATDEA